MSVTTPAQTAIVATVAIQRARAAVEKRAPSASRPPPWAPRAGRAGEVAAAQDLHRRAARGAPRRPRRRRDDDRHHSGQGERERARERRARPELVERGEQLGGRPGDDQRAERDAERRGGHRHERGLDRLLRRDPARAEAERALDAEPGQPALDVGVRARGEHRAGRDQRDERERDEQRDHDPRGL